MMHLRSQEQEQRLNELTTEIALMDDTIVRLEAIMDNSAKVSSRVANRLRGLRRQLCGLEDEKEAILND